MDTKTFLESVLGDEGHYCLWAYRNGLIKQELFDSIDEVIDRAHELDAQQFNAYFALGTFHNKFSRTAKNVNQVRSFFLDIDCGEGKPFPTQVDGLKALRVFCKQTNLPKPTMISSGRGLHVYWRLDKPADRDDWAEVARAFKQACIKNNFEIDTSVPADAARVLRIPGTHHYKDNPPKLVEVIGSLEPPVTLDQFVERFGRIKEKPQLPGSVPSGLTAMLAGNSNSYFKNILVKSLQGTGCEQIKRLTENQEEVDEPLWRAGLSIAWACADRDKAIHKISSRHPNYDASETVQKAQHTQGPYLCGTFDEIAPDICPSCPHWTKIKSPIVLGREIEEVREETVVVSKVVDEPAVSMEFTIPAYPEPYFKGRNGAVYKRTRDKDNDEKDVMVYHNPIYVVGRVRDPEIGESVVVRLHLPKDGMREFTLSLMEIGGKDDLRKALAKHGVAVLDASELRGYIMKWVNELQYRAEADEARIQFGWTDDDLKSFVLGNKEFFADRVADNPPSSKTVQYFPAFKQRGSLDAWVKTMKFFGRPGLEAHQMMLLMSFAAPLVKFFPIHGFGVHIYSEDSGIGKTASLLAGLSAWGNPGLLINNEQDTYNSKMNRSEVFKNLLIGLDELTNMRPVEVSDIAYAYSAGRQKNRMSGKNNQERVRGDPWNTIFGSTGNASLIQKVNSVKAMPKAEAQRIFEYPAPVLPFKTKAETDKLSIEILKNYGHAGPIYIQSILKEMEFVRNLCYETQLRIDQAAGLTAQNRFWSVYAATGMSAGILTKRYGLLDFDLDRLKSWLMGALQDSKEKVIDMSVDALGTLNDYIAENYNNTLRIKSNQDRRKDSVETIVHPEATPRFTFTIRHEYDIKRMYLQVRPLREWCSKRQIDYGSFMQKLQDGPTKAHKEKIRMSKGTHMSMPPADVWVINCDGWYDDEDTGQDLSEAA
jgi:hypothetical protein